MPVCINCCLPYDFDPKLTCQRWLDFLDQSLLGDADKIRLLRQWFGYCLTWDNSQQKMMFLVGLPGAGKGTTSWMLQQLLGGENWTAYRMGSLATDHGLTSLVGKQVAFIGEVNIAKNPHKNQILETLNSIVGGDPVEINPKHQQQFTVTLPTRFLFCCNEMPFFFDATGAFARRLLLVEFLRSFQGREDTTLKDKLAPEIPGVALWALAGLADLRQGGRFHSTQDMEEVVSDIRREASPILAFVQDCLAVEECYHPGLPGLKVEPGPLQVKKDDLWQAWVQWCGQNRAEASTRIWFMRDLHSVIRTLNKKREQVRIDNKVVEVVSGIGLTVPLP